MIYWQANDGSFGRGTDLPVDAVEILQAVYEDLNARWTSVGEAAILVYLAERSLVARCDYEALVALRIPEATAARLTGYTPG